MAAAGLDDVQLAGLRHRLEALHYSEPLDRSSAPLVSRLVDDLLHATESYRAVKQQAAQQAQDLAARGARVRAMPCLRWWAVGRGGVRPWDADSRGGLAWGSWLRVRVASLAPHTGWRGGRAPGGRAWPGWVDNRYSHLVLAFGADLTLGARHRCCSNCGSVCGAGRVLPMRVRPMLVPCVPRPQSETLQHDSARLQAENNELHLMLIQQAERHDQQDRDHYQAVKVGGVDGVGRGPGGTQGCWQRCGVACMGIGDPASGR